MIAEQYKEMLNGKSVIRELSEYATARGKEIGYENVFDYSLGNPSVPAPESFKEAMIKLLMEGDAERTVRKSARAAEQDNGERVGWSHGKRQKRRILYDEIFHPDRG